MECRVRGLHNALKLADFAELGGTEAHASARAELMRLLEATPKQLQEEGPKISRPMRRRYGLSLPVACESLADRIGTVHSLMLLWIFSSAAQLMGAQETWQQLVGADSPQASRS